MGQLEDGVESHQLLQVLTVAKRAHLKARARFKEACDAKDKAADQINLTSIAVNHALDAIDVLCKERM